MGIIDNELTQQRLLKRQTLGRIDAAVQMGAEAQGDTAYEAGRAAGQSLRRLVEDLAQRVCLRTVEDVFR